MQVVVIEPEPEGQVVDCFKSAYNRVSGIQNFRAGNRLLHTLWREAIDIVEQGIASPEDVDLVARMTFGLRLSVVGPLENMDLVGLDLVETIHKYLLADLADNHAPAQYLTDRVRQGHLGVKSGQGFYDWRTREAGDLIQKRDRQIVHQLNFLRELEVKPRAGGASTATGEVSEADRVYPRAD